MDQAPNRDAFLRDLMTTFASNPAYTAVRGTDTDMEISSNPVDPRWAAGKKRVEYTAVLKVADHERTVHFWELLKNRSDTEIEAGMGPGSTSWEWGYGTLRALVEDVAARHGFMVRVALNRHAALY